MTTITVRVQKTVQIKSYEPVTVDLSQTVEVEAGKSDAARLALYKTLTADLDRFIKNEVRKGRAKEDE